ncbi:hypothetical protein JKG47_01825 [Acidithiobacillus sp. MC6.1]|nr:hypothetical protein [Acidithiobacillus sp. MC6.1]
MSDAERHAVTLWSGLSAFARAVTAPDSSRFQPPPIILCMVCQDSATPIFRAFHFPNIIH